jgi:RNA polymerase sigma-70 factor (ECF subfamily)
MDLEQEKKLVENAKSDKQALGEVYDYYYDRIFNYIYRRCGDIHVTEDVTAETFINVVENINKYKARKGINFSAWLYKIATNALNMYFRKQNHYKFIPPEDFDIYYKGPSLDVEIAEAEVVFSNASEFQKIREILLNLDQKYQTVIHLKFFETKSYEEISYITGIKVGTLKSHLSRALEHIRKNLMQPIST